MPDEETVPCKWCGKAIDKRGVINHERFCQENPERQVAKAASEEEPKEEFVLDESETLKKILAEAGVRYRADAIVRAYSRGDTSDLLSLDNILRIADTTTPARRMVLKNWAYQKNLEIPEELSSELEREESEETKKSKKDKAPDTEELLGAMKSTRKEMMDDLRIQVEEVRLKKQLERLEGADEKKGEVEKVEIPFVNPETGDAVYDKDGNPVMVKVDPEQEYKRARAMAMMGMGQGKKESSDNPLLVAMMNQQTALISKLMESNTKTDTGELTLLRQSMEEDRKRYEDMVNALREQNKALMDSQTEERIRRIEMAIGSREDDIDKYIQTTERLKERGLLGGSDQQIEMMRTQRDAMNNSFQIIQQQLRNTNETTRELVGIAKDVYPEVMKDNLKERIKKRTTGAEPQQFSDAQLAQMGAGLPPEAAFNPALTPEQMEAMSIPGVSAGFKVIGGKGGRPVQPE